MGAIERQKDPVYFIEQYARPQTNASTVVEDNLMLKSGGVKKPQNNHIW